VTPNVAIVTLFPKGTIISLWTWSTRGEKDENYFWRKKRRLMALLDFS